LIGLKVSMKELMKIVALDVDDVILDLVPNWLRYYNQDFSDNLTKDKITEWDISKFIKPSAKKAIYEYTENEEIYETAEPVKDALRGVNLIKEYGYRTIYVTANNPYNSKFNWLIKNEFLDDKKDFVSAYDKSLILADYIIDDKWENVADFKGVGFLFNQPWNEYSLYHNRVENWNDIINKIEEGVMFT